jgi:hypothetical protein
MFDAPGLGAEDTCTAEGPTLRTLRFDSLLSETGVDVDEGVY